jgi:hypothetical protein
MVVCWPAVFLPLVLAVIELLPARLFVLTIPAQPLRGAPQGQASELTQKRDGCLNGAGMRRRKLSAVFPADVPGSCL